MEVRVLFFSVLRGITGHESLIWSIPEQGYTVGDLIFGLQERYPSLRAWDRQLLVAVDLEYADRTQVLLAGQEVALMPPVQGG